MSQAESIQAVRMVLGGRVQGVGFRYFTRRAAERLGLVGWVKNLPDGDVEVQVAGPAARLAAFRDELRQGPPGSRVDQLAESELAAPGAWTQFEIAF
jgi:acylphosphatase